MYGESASACGDRGKKGKLGVTGRDEGERRYARGVGRLVERAALQEGGEGRGALDGRWGEGERATVVHCEREVSQLTEPALNARAEREAAHDQ